MRLFQCWIIVFLCFFWFIMSTVITTTSISYYGLFIRHFFRNTILKIFWILLFFENTSRFRNDLIILWTSKRLSNAYHYDWGLHAMKAIPSTVGKAKQGFFSSPFVPAPVQDLLILIFHCSKVSYTTFSKRSNQRRYMTKTWTSTCQNAALSSIHSHYSETASCLLAELWTANRLHGRRIKRRSENLPKKASESHSQHSRWIQRPFQSQNYTVFSIMRRPNGSVFSIRDCSISEPTSLMAMPIHSGSKQWTLSSMLTKFFVCQTSSVFHLAHVSRWCSMSTIYHRHLQLQFHVAVWSTSIRLLFRGKPLQIHELLSSLKKRLK